VLLICGAGTAVSRSKAEVTSGNGSLPPLDSVIATSVPESFNVGWRNSDIPSLSPTFRPEDRALIIGLHKRGAGPAMERYSQLDSKADQEGFAIAYLDGLVER
jgi:poly(3-hydroxybutyrate) depolymerase